MKKIYFVFLLTGITTLLVNAQYKLSSDANSFVVGDKHDFIFVTNSTEGQAGKDVTWDFSGLQKTDKTMTTNMYVSSVSDKSYLIPQANIAIEEAGNLFFFKVTDQGMEQYGAIGGCAVTRYNKPMVKLNFPFQYGDRVSGSYNGVNINQDNSETQVSGTYEILADAYGTLLLPDNVTIKNALRVKQTRTFTNSDLKEITYRWYAKGVRYPILVVIKYESAQKSFISQTALYAHAGSESEIQEQSLAASSNMKISNIEVLPNPFHGQLTIRYKLEDAGRLRIDLIDSNGKLVKNCVDQTLESGYYSHILTLDPNKVGSYFIRFTAGNNVINKKVIQN